MFQLSISVYFGDIWDDYKKEKGNRKRQKFYQPQKVTMFFVFCFNGSIKDTTWCSTNDETTSWKNESDTQIPFIKIFDSHIDNADEYCY